MIQLILVVHFICDHVFQHPWMAINKHKNHTALLWHIAVYTFSLGMFLSPFAESTKSVLIFCILNGLLHYLTDLYTSKISARLHQLENKYYYYCMLGLDQLIHTICLTTTMGLLELK